MLSPQISSQRGGVISSLERLTIHGAWQTASIFHHDRQFAVVNAELRLLLHKHSYERRNGGIAYAIIDVGAAAYDDPVIDNNDLLELAVSGATPVLVH